MDDLILFAILKAFPNGRGLALTFWLLGKISFENIATHFSIYLEKKITK